MGVLRLPGLATGIDTSTLIQQLMIIASRRLATYQVKKNSYEGQNTALTTMENTVNALKSAASALADADTLTIYTATSSDTDILTVSATSEANSGSHSIEVNQLATTETWIQDTSTFDYETDYVGAGNFIYSYNNKESVILATANETTLEDLVNLINNDEGNPGVTASLLYSGGKYHLMLSGKETGEDYQISINSEYTEVWKPNTEQPDHTFTDDSANAGLSTKITELDQFSGGTLQGDEKITISGKNRSGTDLPDKELNITANTTLGHLIDAINEQFDGVATATLVNGQVWLTDNIAGASIMEIDLNWSGTTALDLPTMAVSTEGGGSPATISSLDPSSFIETQDAQSSNIKIDGYPTGATQEVQTLTPTGAPTGGHYHLSYRGETTGEILHGATYAQIQSALEGLTIVDPGDIEVSGSGTDGLADGAVEFEFLSSAGDVEMISIDTIDLTGGTAPYSFTETTKGNNGWIDKNSNSVTDAITGITLNLHDVTEVADPIKITISKNTTAVTSRVQTMVNKFNGLMAELKGKTEYNAETKQMGILSDNIAVSLIKGQARNLFIGILDGFVDTRDDFIQVSDIGITIDGAGMMEFDQDVFNDAVNENYEAVLEVLGATKSGNSTSSIVQFHDASDKYTTAGTYHVKVKVEEIDELNVITKAEIKLPGESIYRDADSWNDGIVTFDSSFDDNGYPVYPENGLQLSVDLTNIGQYGTDENPIIVRVKQGAAGALEDLLVEITKAGGRFDTSEDTLDDKITAMQKTIENEENRLEDVETRLIGKYARLEKILTMLQQQMGAVNMLSTSIFG